MRHAHHERFRSHQCRWWARRTRVSAVKKCRASAFAHPTEACAGTNGECCSPAFTYSVVKTPLGLGSGWPQHNYATSEVKRYFSLKEYYFVVNKETETDVPIAARHYERARRALRAGTSAPKIAVSTARAVFSMW